MKRGLVVNCLLVVVLLLAGWGAWALFFDTGSGDGSATVRTVAASTGDVAETVTAAGSVTSAYTGQASFGTGGTVDEVDVKVGQQVGTGQRLAALDDAQANLQVTVARANLESDQQNLDDTADRPSVTTAQLDQARAKVDADQLALRQAQDSLADTVLTAPGAGTVTAVNGATGDRVGASSSSSGSASSGTSSGASTGASSGSGGTTTGTGSGSGAGVGTAATQSANQSTTGGSAGFVTITDLHHLDVRAMVAEIDVAKLKDGQRAAITVNALPGTAVTGRVSSIDLTPTTSGGVVQYGVTLSVDSVPSGMRPGQSASVQVTVAQADGALTVPSAAVQTDGTTSTVLVERGGRQVRTSVRVGVRGEALVQITAGLSDGDAVVLPSVTTTTTGTGTGRGGGGFTGGGLGGGGGFTGGRGGGR